MKFYYPKDMDGNVIGFKTPESQVYDASGTSLTTKLGNKLDTTSSGYIKALSISGRNITYTKGDGTTGTLTTQDTNTTYSLGSFGVTATADELNKLDGIKSTTTELNYLTGVSSNIQTQLNNKAASSHNHNYAGASTAGGSATSASKLDSSAGSATQPVYFSGGKPVATTYTLGKSVPSDAKFTDTTYSTATTSVNGLMSSTDKNKLNHMAYAHYSTQSGSMTGYYKININSATSWMLSFIIRVYQGYRATDIMVSGYNYGNSYWYSPTAKIISDSGSGSMTITFGYDSAWNLWVAIPANNYTGLDIFDVVNGYSQISSFEDLFTITHMASLTGTTQSTVTAYGPFYRDEVIPISSGGTGSTTAAAARTNLGLGTAATYGVTTSATSGSKDLITSGAVYSGLSGKAATSHTHNYAGSSSAGGAATSALTCTGNAATASNASITTPGTASLKNIQASTTDLVNGQSTLATGTVYLVYKTS